ncbi:MAG: hypothetical protein GTO18_21415 [Anaerolineales bacterium]|nr:hypothetical protein [Anaerolineales bacterium]
MLVFHNHNPFYAVIGFDRIVRRFRAMFAAMQGQTYRTQRTYKDHIREQGIFAPKQFASPALQDKTPGVYEIGQFGIQGMLEYLLPW